MIRNIFLRRALLVCILAPIGCADPLPEGPPKTLATHPRAFDRYTRLKLQELTVADPVAVHRELTCEMDRLFTAFERTEGLLRMKTADDSVYGTPAARAKFDTVQKQFYGKGFEVGGPLCDSLQAIANREDPIAPVDSAIRFPVESVDSIARHPSWEH